MYQPYYVSKYNWTWSIKGEEIETFSEVFVPVLSTYNVLRVSGTRRPTSSKMFCLRRAVSLGAATSFSQLFRHNLSRAKAFPRSCGIEERGLNIELAC